MEIQGDATEAAFLVAENKVGIAARHKARLERIDEIPLTSEPKIISTHELHSQHGGNVTLITKGAPDVLLHGATGFIRGRHHRARLNEALPKIK